jgi:PAP2 superfamily
MSAETATAAGSRPATTGRSSQARAGVMPPRSELLLFGAAYVLYNAGRGLTNGDVDLAVANAHWVIDFQGGIGLERSVQDAFGGVWMVLLSHIYLAAQIVVLPGVLVALYRWAPAIYPRLRSTVIATWTLALPIYALFPVAPPRLAGLGMTDAVSEQSAVALAGHSTWFYNPIAAVPSLHSGFAVAIAIAVAAAVHQRRLRLLAMSWGPIVILSTVATANHYVFDVVAGLAITAVGYATVTHRARVARRPALAQAT